MKLELLCPLCLAHPQVDFEGQLTLVETALRDDGAYLSHCQKGHPFVTHLQEQLFEMLFELAVNAIADGYYREAVSSFTASLERFYEYSLRVFMAAQAVGGSDWEAAWKPISNMSERQLGAYAILHMASLHKSAPLLDEKQVKFRNGVVHKGKIPSQAEALEFGEGVRTLINSGINDLQANYSNEMEFVFSSSVKMPKGAAPGMVATFYHYPTVISLLRMDLRERSTNSLQEIVEYRRSRLRKAS